MLAPLGVDKDRRMANNNDLRGEGPSFCGGMILEVKTSSAGHEALWKLLMKCVTYFWAFDRYRLEMIQCEIDPYLPCICSVIRISALSRAQPVCPET
jgi:hypothetical protein